MRMVGHRAILAALAALGLVATAAADQPERWLYAGMQGGAIGWEASSIKRDAGAGTAAAMRFIYFAKPKQAETGDFTWVFQDIEFNCTANTFRVVEGAFFNKFRGGVADKTRSDDDPIAIRANTPEAVLKQVLCDDAVITEALQATSMADAMDGAERAALR
ncbi:MAG: hypothetical protein Q8R02_25135 [Hyphomonadaceae bacterium]|nr:hypothetical protein [Hyphomonadaceae bacterium]